MLAVAKVAGFFPFLGCVCVGCVQCLSGTTLYPWLVR